jgi:hypothetical protein
MAETNDHLQKPEPELEKVISDPPYGVIFSESDAKVWEVHIKEWRQFLDSNWPTEMEMFDVTYKIVSEAKAKSESKSESKRVAHWLGSLQLFGYLLPHKARDRVFAPAYEEIKEDYLKTCRLRTPWKRHWLTFCFVFRTGLMVADCFRALLTDRAVRFVLALIPNPLKHWWYS